MMSHPLFEAKVRTIIVRTANGFLVANAVQPMLPGRRKRSIERASAADPTYRHFLVNVDSPIFVQAEDVRVLHLNGRIWI